MSVSARILVVQPPGTARSLAQSAPVCGKCSVLNLDVRAVDRRASCHDARADQRSEQFHPKPPPRPAVEAIIDRRRRTVVRRAVAPPAADLQQPNNARNHPLVIDPPGAGPALWQMRLDCRPRLVRQLEQRHLPPPTSHARLIRNSPKINMSIWIEP